MQGRLAEGVVACALEPEDSGSEGSECTSEVSAPTPSYFNETPPALPPLKSTGILAVDEIRKMTSDPVEYVTLLQRYEETLGTDVVRTAFAYLRDDKERRAGAASALVISEFEDLDPHNYYTLSLAGVTHFTDGEAEFTALDDWLLSHKLFRKVSQIKFFAQYQQWCAFKQWRRNVAGRRMKRVSRTLSSDLFSLDERLNGTLKHVRTACGIVIELPKRTTIVANQTHEELAISESKRRLSIQQQLNDAVNGIVDYVADSCTASLGAAFRRRAAPRANSKAAAKVSDALPNVVLSMNDTSMSYTQRAARRAECRRLGLFIRLCDYILVDSLYAMVSMYVEHLDMRLRESENALPTALCATGDNAITFSQITHLPHEPRAIVPQTPGEIVESTEDESKAKRGRRGRAQPLKLRAEKTGPAVSGAVLRVDVSVEGGRIEFTPESEIFAEIISSGYQALVTIAREVPALWSRPAFAEYVKAAEHEAAKKIGENQNIGGGPNLESRLMLDSSPADATGSTMSMLRSAFRALSERWGPVFEVYGRVEVSSSVPMADLEPVVVAEENPLFLAAQDAMDFIKRRGRHNENHEAVEIPIRSNNHLEFLSARLDELQGDLKMVNALPHAISDGIFQLDVRGLKEKLVPGIEDRISEVRECLPALAIGTAEQLTRSLSHAREFIETPVEDLRTFCSRLMFFSAISMTPQSADDSVLELLEGHPAVPFASAVSKTVTSIIDTEFQNFKGLLELADVNGQPVPDGADMLTTANLILQGMITAISANESSRSTEISRWSGQVRVEGEELAARGGELRSRACAPHFDDADMPADRAVKELEQLLDEHAQLLSDAADHSTYCKILGEAETDLGSIEAAGEAIAVRHELWTAVLENATLESEWKVMPFKDLDISVVEKSLAASLKTCFAVGAVLRGSPPVALLEERVSSLKNVVGVLEALSSPCMKSRHWALVEDALGVYIPGRNPEQEGCGNLTLDWLLTQGLVKNRAAVEHATAQAANEAQLSAMLDGVEESWSEIAFEVNPYRDTRDVFVLAGCDPVLSQLDDSMLTLSTVRASRYVGPLVDRVDSWISKMKTASETLEAWLTCQRLWLYLEPIFSAPDIQRQLPVESRSFSIVNGFWRDVLYRAHDEPRALIALSQPGLLDQFNTHLGHLETVQKGLEDYLDTKRQAFGRFYFLSNDELLEILAQTRDPRAVQPHLRKCFENLFSVEFLESSGDAPEIVSFSSGEGEKMPLARAMRARGAVEGWMTVLERSMRDTLKRAVITCQEALSEAPSRGVWAKNEIGQLSIAVSQMVWCAEVEKALSSENPRAALKAFRDSWAESLLELVAAARGDLAKIERQRLVPLITIDVHNRDILDELLAAGVDNVNDFEWQRRLRYSLDENDKTVVVRQLSAVNHYGYEFLGSTSRLVITPLTDRCYLTLSTALSMHLGGAPAGPAGTGKTETVKDLAKALGLYCVVFNASEELEVATLSRIFRGIALTGSFLGIDEFNRVKLEVLSVVANMIAQILTALARKAKTFEFDGAELALDARMGLFITMNPGYAGRTELPDNLVALFRPVAMMVPDYAMIAEIILFSEGFVTAKELSRKMVHLYRLASEQLSSQPHYDFGLRAVKAVLVMAGGLKRAQPELNEDAVLIKAMRDSNVPKFLAEDLPLFEGIVRDLFPGVAVPTDAFPELEEAVREVASKQKLVNLSSQCYKVVQFFQTTRVRHGAMVIGPTGGGKTVVRRLLASAMTKLAGEGAVSMTEGVYQPVRVSELNPKSVAMAELFGAYSELTQEWSDGIAAVLIRDIVASDSPDIERWLVFDGPVDTTWIESLNSTLDDNRLVCLASGERIKISPQVHLIFEVDDLSQASPATVSRCGMVYLDPNTAVDWRGVVLAGLNSLPDEAVRDSARINVEAMLHHLDTLDEEIDEDEELDLTTPFTPRGQRSPRQLLARLTMNSLPGVFEHIANSSLSEVVSTTRLGLSQSFLRVLHAVLVSVPDEHRSHFSADSEVRFLSMSVIFAMVWSLGSYFSTCSETLDVFLRDKFSADTMLPPLPPMGTIFEYAITVEEGVDSVFEPVWTSFSNIAGDYTHDSSVNFGDVVVATSTTARIELFTRICSRARSNVIFVGSSGTGKTSVVSQTLDALSHDENAILPISLQLSAQTSPARIRSLIENRLVSRRRHELGPPLTARGGAVIFVDDTNLPAPEVFGAQPPLELLRQLVDCEGWYDTSELIWHRVVDVSLVGACGPDRGGRAPLPPRFLRHFTVVSVPEAEDLVIKQIFTSMLDGFFGVSGLESSAASAAPMAVDATLAVYRAAEAEMRPTPRKSHYQFNLRDVSAVIQGIASARPANVGTADDILSLWLHETERVFVDRLADEADCRIIKEAMHAAAQRSFMFTKDLTELFVDNGSARPWISFTNIHAPIERRAVEATPIADVAKVLEGALREYNLSSPDPLPLVLFDSAVEQAAAIGRILSTPRGNALLIGVGGSGRRSLSQLAAYATETSVVAPVPTRAYGIDQWHEDLKSVFTAAGVEQKPTMLLISDAMLVDAYLEDICSILTSGEVTGLFATEEREVILGDVGRDAPDGVVGDALWSYFIRRARDNLHVVLCISPVGDAFRQRINKFPPLVNCCTSVYFSEWSAEALHDVASARLEKFDFIVQKPGMTEEEQAENDRLRRVVVKTCVAMHASVAEAGLSSSLRVYAPPTSFLELIDAVQTVLEKQRDLVGSNINRFRGGLKKLDETHESVQQLQKELEALEPQLKESAEKTSAMLVELSAETAEAEKVRRVAVNEEAKVRASASETEAIAQDAQKDLDAALPALEAAVAALAALNKNDINEIKSFSSPPALVQVVMEAVLTLLGEKIDWATAKVTLGESGFLNRLMNYDRDHVPERTLRKLQKYIQNPDFTEETVGRVNVASKSLCLWVRAVDLYAATAKVVEPKRERLRVAQAELDAAQAVLYEKQEALRVVEERLATLQANYDAQIAEKTRLANELDLTERRFARARQLTQLLASERERWGQSADELSVRYGMLVGDCVVAAGALTYLGPFEAPSRRALQEQWRDLLVANEIPHTTGHASLLQTLSDPVVERAWRMSGLPVDAYSTEGALMITESKRYPLIVDPQGQASSWLRAMPEHDNLVVVQQSDKAMMGTIVRCIRVGTPVLVEGVGETIDPSLEPILKQQTHTVAGRTLLRIGDSDVDFDPNFRLFLTSPLATAHYLPEVQMRVTLVNFSVTEQGLSDQLLIAAVAVERPELENQRSELIVSISEDRKTLVDLESKILSSISNSTGNILDDQELISTLQESKNTAEVVSRRVAEAEVTQSRINEALREYKPVAALGSQLYFVLSALGRLERMYVTPAMPRFMALYREVLDTAAPSSDVDKRVQSIRSTLLSSVYRDTTRRLFGRDTLLLSLLICLSLCRANDEVSGVQEGVLMLGSGSEMSPAAMEAASGFGAAPEGISVGMWHMLVLLGSDQSLLDQRVEAEEGPAEEDSEAEAPARPTFGSKFRHVVLDISSRPEKWIAWASGTPECSIPPSVLTPIERLLTIRALAPSRYTYAVSAFVSDQIGSEFVSPVPLSLPAAFKDSSATTPMLFILSPGADPLAGLQAVHDTMGPGKSGKSLATVSLGQGQGPIAEAAICSASRTGGWVFLANAHLGSSWMERLDRMVLSIVTGAPSPVEKLQVPPHPDFRLWISSSPSSDFPLNVLQLSLRMTTEAPAGLRANLLRSVSDITEEQWESPLTLSSGDILMQMYKETAYDDAISAGASEDDAVAAAEQAVRGVVVPDVKLPDEALLIYKRLLFNTMLYHGVLQERRKFGPIGWNVVYPFNDCDLITALRQVASQVTTACIPSTLRANGRLDLEWAALRYLGAEVCYGGRITDGHDRTLAATLLHGFYNRAVIIDGSPVLGLVNPVLDANTPLDDIRAHVNALPLADSAQQLGLHATASAALDLRRSQALAAAHTASSRGISRAGGDEEVVLIKKCETLISRLPPPITLEKAHEASFSNDSEGLPLPLSTVLSQEVDKFNLLRSVVVSTFQEIIRAVKGLVVLSPSLQTAMEEVEANKVPSCFGPVAYPSLLTLQPWVIDLASRIEFFRDWVLNGPPATFRLPAFHFPQGFLTAVLQTHARRHNVAVDSLSFRTTAACGDIPVDGVVVSGLCLECAHWDGEVLQEPVQAGAEAFVDIHFEPTQEDVGGEGLFACPVYKTAERRGVLGTTGLSTSFVATVYLPCTDADALVRRSAALICEKL